MTVRSLVWDCPLVLAILLCAPPALASGAGIDHQLDTLSDVAYSMARASVWEMGMVHTGPATIYRYVGSALAGALVELEAGRSPDTSDLSHPELLQFLTRLSQWYDLLATVPGSERIRYKLTDAIDNISWEVTH